jgi:hypothetical protein
MRHLGAAEVKFVASSARHSQYEGGSVVYSVGDLSDYFFVVASGHFQESVPHPSGVGTCPKRLHSTVGASFGSHELLFGGLRKTMVTCRPRLTRTGSTSTLHPPLFSHGRPRLTRTGTPTRPWSHVAHGSHAPHTLPLHSIRALSSHCDGAIRCTASLQVAATDEGGSLWAIPKRVFDAKIKLSPAPPKGLVPFLSSVPLLSKLSKPELTQLARAGKGQGLTQCTHSPLNGVHSSH